MHRKYLTPPSFFVHSIRAQARRIAVTERIIERIACFYVAQKIHKNHDMVSLKLRKKIGFVGIFTALSSFASATNFSDVAPQHPAKTAIDFVASTGLVEGYSDGSFRPDWPINRAEMNKILVQKESLTTTQKNCFDDVTDEWFSPFVCAAKQQNWIAGYPDGFFRPDRSVNFAESAKIIVNALEIPTYSENDDLWYSQFLRALTERSAIPDSLKNPAQIVTRGEFVQILYALDPQKNNTTPEEFSTTAETKTESISNFVPIKNSVNSESANNFEIAPEEKISFPIDLLSLISDENDTTETTINIGGIPYVLNLRPKFEQYDRLELKRIPGTSQYRMIVPTN
jgi:hypothetical protein